MRYVPGAVICLFLFVFPQTLKSIHDFQHKDDHQCTEKSLQHFHQMEHKCTLCDFSIPGAYHELISYVSPGIKLIFTETTGLQTTILFIPVYQHLPQRAPPVDYI